MLKNEIINILRNVLSIDDIDLAVPTMPEYGDFTTSVALKLKSQKEAKLKPSATKDKTTSKKSKTEDKSAREIAEELVQLLQNDKELSQYVSKIEVAGPGFINFWLSNKVLDENLQSVLSNKDDFGKSESKKGKKIMVEFAHPNTHKEFHIGHLRNITLGESISRLLEANGYKIIRANYQGDIGMHIAKALWGIQKLGFEDPVDIKKRVRFLGKAYATGATAYEEDKKIKSEIQVINKKIYSKEDEKINKIYTETRQWSLDYFESIYKRVYTKFDRLYFESEVFVSGKKYAEKALEKGILKKSNGAVIFEGSKFGLHDRVFISGKGTPTYEAKDFGLVILQMKEYDPDLIVHVLGPEQLGYTSVIFKAQELLFPETEGKQLHVPYGWVKLKHGKMASRTGNVVLGEMLLDDAKEKILKNYNNTGDAEKIAVAAVKYSFLKVGKDQEIAFDIDESISIEGNSGPYLQYTYARVKSVLQKAKYNPVIASGAKQTKTEIAASPFDKLRIPRDDMSSEEDVLLRALPHFPEVIAEAAERYAPNLICNYLYDLAQKFNSFYNSQKIVGGEREEFKLALTAATAQILQNGLRLLGIKTLEKM